MCLQLKRNVLPDPRTSCKKKPPPPDIRLGSSLHTRTGWTFLIHPRSHASYDSIIEAKTRPYRLYTFYGVGVADGDGDGLVAVFSSSICFFSSSVSFPWEAKS